MQQAFPKFFDRNQRHTSSSLDRHGICILHKFIYQGDAMSLAFLNKLLVSLSLFTCSSVFAAPLVVDVAGIESHGFFGDPANTVLNFNVGANAIITSVAFSGTVSAYSPSFLSELTVAFSDSHVNDGLFYYPGYFDIMPGTATYSESVDLVAAGLSFAVGADGILRLEFFETMFNDFGGADGIWDSGVLIFGVEAPGEASEPATGLLLGAGLAMMGYIGRRRGNVGLAVERTRGQLEKTI
jgi:hypothetical protein